MSTSEQQPPTSLPTANPTTEQDESPPPVTFTLVVVSPSVGVDRALTFQNLPAVTSVKELKAKIRDVLPSSPPDDHQRLIHRGRLLARDTETMSDVFGISTVSFLTANRRNPLVKSSHIDHVLARKPRISNATPCLTSHWH